MSLLMDSMLCALVPLVSLTSLIPEFRSVPQHTLTCSANLDPDLFTGRPADITSHVQVTEMCHEATAGNPRGSSLRGTSTSEELRLVLLGTLGCGKTASADTILGHEASASTSSFGSSSRMCHLRQGVTEGRKVTLVEAPRWYWNGKQVEDSVRRESQRALELTSPGPHAFLLLIPVCQFTEVCGAAGSTFLPAQRLSFSSVEGLVPVEMKEVFGPNVLKHTLVLLTCGDYLGGQNEEIYLQGEDPGLREVIGRCRGRYHIINNRQRHDRQQVRTLLDKVENMVALNGGYYMNTSQQSEVDHPASLRKQQLSIIEPNRVVVEEAAAAVAVAAAVAEAAAAAVAAVAAKDPTIDSKETPVAKTRRGHAPWETERSPSPRLAPPPTQEVRGHRNAGIYSQPTPKHHRDNGLDAEYTATIQSSVSDQLNAAQQKIDSVREQSSPKTSLASSSTQSPISNSSSSLLPRSSSYSTSSSPELRLVLLGSSGAGKSVAGNSILGKEEFETRPDSLVAVTQQCEKRRALISGWKVAVIDTPDWFHSECSPDAVRAQISSCVALSSPGPHAFLLCVPLDRPARSELQSLGVLEAVFGEEAVRLHTLLLFTHADQLWADGKAGEQHHNVEEYIAAERGDLLKLVEKCGDRFHVLERGPSGPERRSVDELLAKVAQTVTEAGGSCYSCPAFQEAEERVRQRQREIANERKRRGGRRVDPESRRTSHPSMQTLPEADEDQEDMDGARDEAERMVSTMCLESLPPITASTLSPSLMSSMKEMMGSTAKWLPKMLADGSVWVGDGVKKMGTRAKDVHKIVADSSVWEKVSAKVGGVTKPLADSDAWQKTGANQVPGLTSSSSSAIRSQPKMVANSALWEKVGSRAKSGAKLMSDGSLWVGSGAKSLAQSPVWGQVGSGAKTGAKMMADGSVRVGAGLGAGVKQVAQSPVWGKMGSGAKAGVKMVAESSIWEKMMTEAKKVPKVVAGGAFLGLLLGVFFGGVLGGAVGAATGSLITEVGRRKFSKDGNSVDVQNEGMRNNMSEAQQSLIQSSKRVFKAE
ncbi:GTPase IMAP family member 4 [Merluccius polli]|uniref:GTPase IMAP family member 4 n=1 Tax=Merluccius polli TaxID=89951 RepID=A0AA47MXV6_MERPO|nr:GTPase IMAP family member 4 [Merluccius polli]